LTLITETAISLIFLISILTLEFKINNIIQRINKTRRSVNQYTLMVEGFEDNKNLSTELG